MDRIKKLVRQDKQLPKFYKREPVFANGSNSFVKCKHCKKVISKCVCHPKKNDNFRIYCANCSKKFGKCSHTKPRYIEYHN